MIRKLVACLIVTNLISSCVDEPSGYTEPVIPDNFTRAQYYNVHFKNLENLCKLLEHLYAQPNADQFIVSELERLVAGEVIIIRLKNFDINDLGYDEIEGFLALLSVSESDKFGRAWNNPLLIEPSLDILRRDRDLLLARREEIRSNIRVD